MAAPSFFTTISSKFPLIVYPPSQSTEPPKRPTIWIVEPFISSTKLSSDVESLTLQAMCAFHGLAYDTITWSHTTAGPGGNLPALHLPNGDLIDHERVLSYVHRYSAFLRGKYGGDEQDREPEELSKDTEFTSQAYLSLIDSKISPALLAEYAMEPPKSDNEKSTSSFLEMVRYFESFTSTSAILERIKTLTRRNQIVSFDDVINPGVDALRTLADAYQGTQWFLDTRNALPLDAVLFAYLRLIQNLDQQSPLRRELYTQRLAPLRKWIESSDDKYFASS